MKLEEKRKEPPGEFVDFLDDGGSFPRRRPVRRYLVMLFAVALLGSFACGLAAGHAADDTGETGEVLSISNRRG